MLAPGIKDFVFALLGLGFAIKSGMVPFHIWLPRAHPIAPAPVSGLMSGAMIKLGVFGVTQFLLMDLGKTSVIWPFLLLVFGAVSSLLGVLYALMEHDLKRLLAFHSIENIGIIFLGLGVMGLGIDWHRPLLEATGMIAALFHTLNHAIFKSPPNVPAASSPANPTQNRSSAKRNKTVSASCGHDIGTRPPHGIKRAMTSNALKLMVGAT